MNTKNRLVEAYAKRLEVSNKVYAEEHNGRNLSDDKKVLIATMLNNVNKRMNEALGFNGSLATQRSDMGEWKKFCLALTSVAIPNLIASDLVLTHPMTSIHGYVSYVNYSYGQDKGDVKAGQLVRNPFGFKSVSKDYTGAREAGTFVVGDNGAIQLDWFPIVAAEVVGGESGQEVVEITDAENGIIKVAGFAKGESARIRYIYNNEIIPQKKLPTLVASMDGMELHAKTRRIAVMYSQLAAYEAKQDYGFDLPEQLSAQAVAELSYEIDNEVVSLLAETAEFDEELTFNATLPNAITMRDHYSTFLATVEKAKKIVYLRTKKCVPNYMVCAADVKVILAMIPEAFKASGIEKMAGPYFAGTLNGLKVYVHPEMEENTFFLGVNSSDMATSAAVFAPYMPIIPSSLTDLPDGTSIQGWATMYDLRILNKDLLVAGKVVHNPQVVYTAAA